VGAACELLGFDSLYIANEGKLAAAVAPEDAASILEVMKHHKYGRKATITGEVVNEHPGQVVMKTSLGATRIIDMPVGELLPRIC
jgi:hydrogenase expression/formation protein HypE